MHLLFGVQVYTKNKEVKMKAKQIEFKLIHGDTDPLSFKYGVRIQPTIHGKRFKRKYDVIYCHLPECGKQLLVNLEWCCPKERHRYPPEQQYKIPTTTKHNQRKYCDAKCLYEHRKQTNKGIDSSVKGTVIPTGKKGGFYYTTPSVRQTYAWARRIVNPI